ncbi:MAG TPA: formate dehydrogenase subunit gamma [Woeseiaceae bacterium]|jgi:formate dehydrogenase subunit gamma
MPTRYDPEIGAEIIASFGARPEMLVQILRGICDRYSFISDAALRQVAEALNLSRADVHGVVSFYHDFRTAPPGRKVVKICQAESCQAMGGRELTAHAEQALGIALHETTADGEVTLEPVYCLGNCACSPAVMIDERVHGRVDAAKLDRLLGRGAA